MKSENTRAALLMVAAEICFVVNDTIMKGLSDDVPLFQAIFVRGLMATALLAGVAYATGQLNFRIPRQDRGRLVIRSIAEASVGALYLAALFNMPIANAVAILQVSPLAVAFGAYLFLGEPLGRRRLWAIAIGFVGVMLIVRPGLDGFNIYSLCAMAGIVALATRDLITRTMTSNLPTLTVATTGSAAVTVLAGTGMLFSDWTPLEPASVVRLGSAVVWLMLAYFFAIAVMRIGEIGFVAPFRYTGLLAAIIAGIIVFREWPDAWMLLGSAIIVTTGLYLTYRESLET